MAPMMPVIIMGIINSITRVTGDFNRRFTSFLKINNIRLMRLIPQGSAGQFQENGFQVGGFDFQIRHRDIVLKEPFHHGRDFAGIVFAGIIEKNPSGKPYITQLVAQRGRLLGYLSRLRENASNRGDEGHDV